MFLQLFHELVNWLGCPERWSLLGQHYIITNLQNKYDLQTKANSTSSLRADAKWRLWAEMKLNVDLKLVIRTPAILQNIQVLLLRLLIPWHYKWYKSWNQGWGTSWPQPGQQSQRLSNEKQWRECDSGSLKKASWCWVIPDTPIGLKPQNKTQWRDYISQLDWEHLGITQEELEFCLKKTGLTFSACFHHNPNQEQNINE